MNNRHALIIDCRVTQATGTGERDAAREMAADLSGAHQKTIGADTNYDTKGFVAEMMRLCAHRTRHRTPPAAVVQRSMAAPCPPTMKLAGQGS